MDEPGASADRVQTKFVSDLGAGHGARQVLLVSEDEEHGGYKEVQKLTDKYVDRIDELAERKNNEILEF